MKFNPKDMEKAMRQLGIKNENVDAVEVLIKLKDRELVIKNPNVAKVTMGGQESFQVSGDVSERTREPYSEEDVKMVAEQAGVSESDARAALEKTNGDIAAAIMELS